MSSILSIFFRLQPFFFQTAYCLSKALTPVHDLKCFPAYGFKHKKTGKHSTCRMFTDFISSRGRENRTPINGFGDRCTATVPFPYSVSIPLTKDIIPQGRRLCKEFFHGILHVVHPDDPHAVSVLPAALNAHPGDDTGIKPQLFRLGKPLRSLSHSPDLAA